MGIFQDFQVALNETCLYVSIWCTHHVFSLSSVKRNEDLLPAVQLILAEVSTFKTTKFFVFLADGPTSVYTRHKKVRICFHIYPMSFIQGAP